MKQKPLHREVRFHLGKGVHYGFWQIKVMQGRKRLDEFYYNPAYYQLELRGCKLVNKVNKAKKVHAAGVKDVSGWVQCDEVLVDNEISVYNLEKLHYNPIKDIRWRRESDCGEFSWDDYKFDALITNGKQVYVLEETSSG